MIIETILTGPDLIFSLFFQYLIYPNSVGPGGWLNDRIAILSVIVLLAALVPIEQKWMKQVFGFIVLTTIILNLINLSVSCYRLNEEIKEFNVLRDKIGEKKFDCLCSLIRMDQPNASEYLLMELAITVCPMAVSIWVIMK